MPASTIPLAPHVMFFWARLACLFILLPIGGKRILNEELKSDILFLGKFNVFQFYLVVSSIISGNIHRAYLSMAMMLHNAILAIFIPTAMSSDLIASTWIAIVLVSLTFLLEAFWLLYMIYAKRFENNLERLRKVGVDPRINNAFAVRKALQTFGSINIFLVFAVLGKDFVPPLERFNGITLLSLSYAILSSIQQLFISANFNDEDITQRKVAIFLSFARLPIIICIIVWCAVGPKHRATTHAVSIFIFSDILVISLIVNYILLCDTSMFGSGLKESLIFKTKIFDLSSK